MGKAGPLTGYWFGEKIAVEENWESLNMGCILWNIIASMFNFLTANYRGLGRTPLFL